jgi:hypothetical protein
MPTKGQKAGSTIASGATGAAAGAAFGPIGAAVGGAAGLLSGWLMSMDPKEQENTLENARIVQHLKNKKNPSRSERKQLAKILKKQPYLQDSKKLDALLKVTPTDLQGLAQLKGSEKEGYPAQELRFQKYTPEQQAGMSQVLQGGLGELGKNQFDFAPIEQQALRNFHERTIPSIASRFSAIGTGGGGQRTGAFRQQLSQAGKGLEQDLAAMRQNYNLTREGNLNDRLKIGLQPQYASTFFPGQAGTGGGNNQGNMGQQLAQALMDPRFMDMAASGFGSLKDRWNTKKNTSSPDQFQGGQAYTYNPNQGSYYGNQGQSQGSSTQQQMPFQPAAANNTGMAQNAPNIPFNPSSGVQTPSMNQWYSWFGNNY